MDLPCLDGLYLETTAEEPSKLRATRLTQERYPQQNGNERRGKLGEMTDGHDFPRRVRNHGKPVREDGNRSIGEWNVGKAISLQIHDGSERRDRRFHTFGHFAWRGLFRNQRLPAHVHFHASLIQMPQ